MSGVTKVGIISACNEASDVSDFIDLAVRFSSSWGPVAELAVAPACAAGNPGIGASRRPSWHQARPQGQLK
jgi:hypothetical protein